MPHPGYSVFLQAWSLFSLCNPRSPGNSILLKENVTRFGYVEVERKGDRKTSRMALWWVLLLSALTTPFLDKKPVYPWSQIYTLGIQVEWKLPQPRWWDEGASLCPAQTLGIPQTMDSQYAFLGFEPFLPPPHHTEALLVRCPEWYLWTNVC